MESKAAYKEMCTQKRTISGDNKDAEDAQIVYHAIFGTFKEDLGVLAQITKQGNWKTRNELGTCFKCQGDKNMECEFTLIEQSYYSKLTSALQTPILASNYIPNCSAPVFSGLRKHKYSDDFFAMVKKKTRVVSFSQSWDSILEGLKKTFEDIVRKIEGQGKEMEMGTVTWRQVDYLSWQNAGSLINLVVEVRNLHFLGKGTNITFKRKMYYLLL